VTNGIQSIPVGQHGRVVRCSCFPAIHSLLPSLQIVVLWHYAFVVVIVCMFILILVLVILSFALPVPFMSHDPHRIRT
jgi:hypothetical protein